MLIPVQSTAEKKKGKQSSAVEPGTTTLPVGIRTGNTYEDGIQAGDAALREYLGGPLEIEGSRGDKSSDSDKTYDPKDDLAEFSSRSPSSSSQDRFKRSRLMPWPDGNAYRRNYNTLDPWPYGPRSRHRNAEVQAKCLRNSENFQVGTAESTENVVDRILQGI